VLKGRRQGLGLGCHLGLGVARIGHGVAAVTCRAVGAGTGLVIMKLLTLRDHLEDPCPPCHHGLPSRCGTSSPRCCQSGASSILRIRCGVTGAGSATGSCSTSLCRSCDSVALTRASPTRRARRPRSGPVVTSGSRPGFSPRSHRSRWMPTTASWVWSWRTSRSMGASPRPPVEVRSPGPHRSTDASKA
jgi:hypothetical protein